MDSFMSRVNPFLLRLDTGDTHIQAMLVEGYRPITVYANGCKYYR